MILVHALAALPLALPSLAAEGWLPPPVPLDPANPGFPTQATMQVSQEDYLFVDAILYRNHEQIFLTDLVKKRNVLPVALRLGLRGRAQETSSFKLAPDSMLLRLYLPDGTALQSVPYTSLESEAKETYQVVVKEALKADTPLDPYREDGRVYFVFFRLPEGSEVRGTEIVRERGQLKQRLSLLGSLAALRLSDPKQGAQIEVKVGLREDMRTLPGS